VTRTRALGIWIVATVAALGVAAAVLWIVPSSEYLFLPDPARPVDPLVSVPHEDTSEDTGGGIYMVDVSVRKARLFERVFPGIHEGATLVPARVFNPTGEPEKVRRQQSFAEMSVSQRIAIAVALRHLGYTVDATGAEVVTVRVGSPADGMIEPGDVVVRAKGKPIHGPQDLFDAMAGHHPGDPVSITVQRKGRARDLRVGTTEAPDDPSRAIMGITVEPAFHYPVDVHINAGNVGGPSAGLAFALDVVDELGDDVDHGRRVVATGEISLDGTVSEIGGIEQKTIGAREAGANLFLVPDGNAAEARKYAKGLRIVPVSTFDEALSSLATR
jgi:Lon-like protease